MRLGAPALCYTPEGLLANCSHILVIYARKISPRWLEKNLLELGRQVSTGQYCPLLEQTPLDVHMCWPQAHTVSSPLETLSLPPSHTFLLWLALNVTCFTGSHLC